MDITAPFFFAAKLYPRRPALMWIGGGVTYAMLAETVLSAARHLERAGVTQEKLVAVDVNDAHRHTIVILALMRLGVTSVSLERSQDEYLSRGHASLAIVDRPRPDFSIKCLTTAEEWFVPVPDEAPPFSKGFAGPDALFRVRLTSGTTGRPEPVAMNVADAFDWISRKRPFEEEGRVLSMMGYSSGVGVRTLLRALGNGGTYCLAGNAQQAYDAIQLCVAEHVYASPAQLRALAECARQAGAPPRSLRSIVVGGSQVSSGLLAAAQRFLCSNVLVAYGAAELGFVAVAPAAAIENRPGAAGYLLPDFEAEALDTEGQPLPPGQQGELRLRGGVRPATASGPAQYKSFREGWFYPGDLGAVDPDGMLIVSGRLSEVINTGGVKVAPEIVEEALMALGGVRDAAAFAMKGENGEDEIWAAVVTSAPPDVRALLAACRERIGARAPSVILRAGAIPRNAAGKVMRAQLAREVEAIASRAGAGKQS